MNVDYLKSMPDEYYQAITLDYGLDVTKNIFTDFTVSDDEKHLGYGLNKTISLDAITETYTKAIEHMDDYAKYSELITSLTTVMSQCIPNNDYILSQYDIVSGDLPKDKTDILIVLDSKSMLTDLLLVQLGYYDQDDFFKLVRKGLDEETDNALTQDEYISLSRFSYSELMGKKFTWYPNDVVFTQNTDPTTAMLKPFIYNYEENASFKDGVKLNVCGIVKPKKGISYGSLSTGFLYTEDFARMTIEANYSSKINELIRSRNDFKFENDLGSITDMFYQSIDGNITYGLDYYWEFGTGADFKCAVVEDEQITLSTKSAASQLMGFFGIASQGKFLSLRGLGGDYMPETISIYPNDFENKDLVTDYLDRWNSTEDVTFNRFDNDFTTIKEENVTLKATSEARREIKYTDSVEIIINMMNTMIDIVTYALVAFTALSLVVSCVMIAIITYVSVMERIKEIGVIRSLGGRKKDVSHLFNAETFIIGLSSGLIGIGVTGLISLIANVIVNALSNGSVPVIANLTFPTALIMVIISVVLTTISGLVPSASAAKKDPVVALRTE